MLDLTDRAIDRLKEMVAEQSEAFAGIRFAVEAGGCSGFQYSMKLENDKQDGDEVIQLNGVQVFVDEQSLLYLDGTQIDYVQNWKGEGFQFSNPNVSGTCGCGESFSV
ncbi:MAG: iron-sulfur cluster assembly accessory protein [Acidobacteriota bacterium]